MAKRIAARNGIMDLVYSCREQSRIVLTVYILIPTGGVFTPMVTMTHMRSPRCTGSIHTDWHIGRRIGVRSSITTEPSINIPTNTRRIIIRISTREGLVVMPVINVVIF